ncbi:MAG: FAD-binding oxidoreductase [Bacteroidota bacterium]
MDFDFIIVGQGIAGSLLTYELIKAGKVVLVVDSKEDETCSHTGAGIMHPITGRRMVKQWKADTLIPYAKNKYRELESVTGNDFFYELPILEIYTSVKNRNDWSGRSSEQGFESYLGAEVNAKTLQKYFYTDSGGILINGSGYVNMHELVNSLRTYIRMKNAYWQTSYFEEDADFEGGFVRWNGVMAEYIIYCTGSNATDSMFFKDLPFLPAKGEILNIYSEELPQEFIVNREMYILPVGNHHFRVGATYEWDFINDVPTEYAKEKIESFLKKILKAAYQITDHKAGIRPSTQDRRPFIGMHPQHPQIGIFSGLGTKGAMLAPYYAKQFADFLLGETKIDDEVNVRRVF